MSETTAEAGNSALKKPSAGGGLSSASAETASPYPKMDLCQQIHQVLSPKSATFPNLELQKELFDRISTELENPSLYRWLRDKLYDGTIPDADIVKLTEEQLSELDDKHKKHLEELAAKVDVAKESAGEMEVMDAHVAIAQYCAKSMSEKDAIDGFQKVIDLPKLSSGKKIDTLMELARVASFYGDTTATDDYIERANKLANEGGGADWDRRNRLKVYKALQRMIHRDMQTASTLLLDCIATFSCSEICSYTEFIVYAILTNLVHLPRPELKSKIIDGPEILSVAPSIPVVINLVRSFYDCDYKAYLHAMVEVEDVLLKDRYLHPHCAFWMREMHILAYKQFLDSYQSVTLQAMADAFGVSTSFIDYHASRFIAANRLSAKIDKYGGVIVTNRPDLKNAQYREIIQKGDLLLNRIQKLARVVDL